MEGKRRFRELVAEELQRLLQRETKEMLNSRLEKERLENVGKFSFLCTIQNVM